MALKIGDLRVDTLLKSLKKEIKQNKEHDKYGIATIILVSIYNALSDSYVETVNDLKKKIVENSK